VEHDLSILDYVSDFVCIMFGKPGAFGVISTPHATGNAINMFFSGYIRSDNIRFRPEAFNFRETLEIIQDDGHKKQTWYTYDNAIIEYDHFKLNITTGDFMDSSLIVLLGKNGTGKTTFLNHLAKSLGLIVSYKTQYLDIGRFINKQTGKYPRVNEMLSSELGFMFSNSLFATDVMKPMDVERLYDKKLNKLSGGELQRVMIVHALGQNANVYLIDEPSACLDVEQRTIVTKVIKRFMLHNKKTGFIVEHDMMMAMSLSMEHDSKIVVFNDGFNNETTKREATSSKPMHFSEGINNFLKQMDITFRTDETTRRPRINKHGSSKDIQQKKDGKYYG
jgi:ATP-binding cassette subfamily E protein 1